MLWVRLPPGPLGNYFLSVVSCQLCFVCGKGLRATAVVKVPRTIDHGPRTTDHGPRTTEMARSSIGSGRWALNPERGVRFPYEPITGRNRGMSPQPEENRVTENREPKMDNVCQFSALGFPFSVTRFSSCFLGFRFSVARFSFRLRRSSDGKSVRLKSGRPLARPQPPELIHRNVGQPGVAACLGSTRTQVQILPFRLLGSRPNGRSRMAESRQPITAGGKAPAGPHKASPSGSIPGPATGVCSWSVVLGQLFFVDDRDSKTSNN